ncbi:MULTISPECIES: transglutaminase family protein [unclassified Beijerinckia]|uniref:transglutaminase family protein n=1 Tax=unclassified Beijerinckia TaxID=2638183 RepID=UPI00089628CB|nr:MULTISPECIES: transglutaminase family protein [unclassified Beijerinckia]MDH7799778.1 transglutaminase-like putative cysteine protease [Beijerinckia sp. GAS462]SED37079.1 Transglutaminase-like enzyme, putative cysteine protease [Beijerinckia sp. 28-YEA-48]
MIYDVTHLTSYEYELPVASADFMLCLTPHEGNGQHVINTRIEIDPPAMDLQARQDFFGNRTTVLKIARPHQALDIRTVSRIQVDRPQAPAAALTRPWERVAQDALNAPSLGPQSPVHFLYASRLAHLYAPATQFARVSFMPGRPVLEAGIELMTRIRDEFRYVPGTTAISTPLAQVFDQRSGVCQDFAHIMIAGLRGLGLSAAYVSGYIRTITPPGRPRLQGADASHAWVSLWCGAEFGWIGLDPTNALLIGDDHVEVATGRDYSDVSPVKGVFIGSGRDSLTVSVDVAPV